MMLGRMVFFSVSALWVLSEKERMVLIMNIKMDKIEELLSTLKKKEDEKQTVSLAVIFFSALQSWQTFF